MSKITILVGSVYGGAEELAETCESRLKAAGHEAQIFIDAELSDVLAADSKNWLIITSTTGAGDVPPNLENVFFTLKDTVPNLSETRYAVICMGDSSYVDTFCEAGKQFDEAMQESMAKRIIERLEIDACETMDTAEASEAWFSDYIAQL
ncbi:flavodoxin [Catenovulum sediminis]|uniref:Flavodoxin n=1 Tax=Catenovulum sediminis TaxID=1740262 RepID=A0ABV1RJ25_9ALTE|nr:flavodoxin [Catenovulum sediminis]